MKPALRKGSLHSGWSSTFPFTLTTSLIITLSTISLPASQVVAYGYNMGVAPVLTNAVAVGVVGYSLASLRDDTTVAQWGNGETDPGVSNLVAIATGWPVGLGLRADGSVTGWSTYYIGDYYGVITNYRSDLTNAVALAVGFNAGYAVRADGTVAAWGNNDYQQLNVPEGLSNVVEIAAAVDGSTTMALCADGTIMEWGYNGTNSHPELSNVVAVATAGAFMNAAIHFDGSVTVWPTDNFYPLPDNLTNIVAASGGGNIVFLRNNGAVVPWGCECHSDFTSISNLTDVAALAGGGGDGYNLNIFLLDYTNPPPVLAAEMSNHLPRLRLTGLRFHNYVLEESADLSSPANWTFKQNLVLPASAEFAVDLHPAADGNARFYRARLMP